MSKDQNDYRLSTHEDVLHQGGVSNCFNRHIKPIKITHWQEHIEYILHLTHFSHYMMLLTGANGSGKTSFIQTLITAINDSIEYRLLDGNTISHPSELLSAIASHYQIDINFEKEATSHQIESIQQALSQLKKAPLIIVDNAEFLSKDTLVLLYNIMTSQSHSPALHCLLIAHPDIEHVLKLDDLKDCVDAHSHRMHLNPFNRSEIRKFIHVYMEASGFATSHYFTEQQLDSIIEHSSGNPAEVKYLAMEHLRDLEHAEPMSSQSNETEQTDTMRETVSVLQHPWLQALCGMRYHFALAFSVLVLVGVLIGFQNSINQSLQKPLQESKLALPKEVMSSNAESILIASNLVQVEKNAKTEQTSHHVLSTRMPANTLRSDINQSERLLKKNDKPALDVEAFKKQEVATVHLQQTPPKSFSEPKKPIKKQPTRSLSKTERHTSKPDMIPNVKLKTVTQSQAKKRVLLSKMSNKLMAMDAKHYALQLLGVRDKAKLQKYIAKQNLHGDYYIVETKLRGGPWFVLLYGDFSQRQQAVKAIKQLPKAIRDKRPWPRKIADLQAKLQQNKHK